MPRPRKPNKKNYRIVVHGVRRKNPDFKRLSKALIELAVQEQRQERLLEEIKAHDPRITIEHLEGSGALRLGGYHFLFFIQRRLACCLPPLMRAKAIKQFGNPAIGYLCNLETQDVVKRWVVLPESASATDWQTYSEAAVRYAIKLTPYGVLFLSLVDKSFGPPK